MPIFEYVCKKCRTSFELFIQGSQKAECPFCGSKSLEKKFSSFAVKGNSGDSGLYQKKKIPPFACGGHCAGGSCHGLGSF